MRNYNDCRKSLEGIFFLQIEVLLLKLKSLKHVMGTVFLMFEPIRLI